MLLPSHGQNRPGIRWMDGKSQTGSLNNEYIPGQSETPTHDQRKQPGSAKKLAQAARDKLNRGRPEVAQLRANSPARGEPEKPKSPSQGKGNE